MKEIDTCTTSVRAIHGPLTSKRVLCISFTSEKVLVRAEYSTRVEPEQLVQRTDGKFLIKVPKKHKSFSNYNIKFYCIFK
jgi:hypothetical protein